MYFPCSQYGEAQLKDFTIAAEVPNHCVKIGSEVALVQNILQCETEVYIVYRLFLSHKAFFTYPLDSEKLDIHVVDNVSVLILMLSYVINLINGTKTFAHFV